MIVDVGFIYLATIAAVLLSVIALAVIIVAASFVMKVMFGRKFK